MSAVLWLLLADTHHTIIMQNDEIILKRYLHTSAIMCFIWVFMYVTSIRD